MVLVSEDAVNRYELRQRLETSPIMFNTMQKDTQMSNVLQRDGMSDDQKQKLFNTELERYLELRQQKDSQIPSVRVVKDEKEHPVPEPAMYVCICICICMYKLYLNTEISSLRT